MSYIPKYVMSIACVNSLHKTGALLRRYGTNHAQGNHVSTDDGVTRLLPPPTYHLILSHLTSTSYLSDPAPERLLHA